MAWNLCKQLELIAELRRREFAPRTTKRCFTSHILYASSELAGMLWANARLCVIQLISAMLFIIFSIEKSTFKSNEAIRWRPHFLMNTKGKNPVSDRNFMKRLTSAFSKYSNSCWARHYFVWKNRDKEWSAILIRLLCCSISGALFCDRLFLTCR